MAVTTSESVTPTEVNGQPVEPQAPVTVPEPTPVKDDKQSDKVEIELLHEFVNNMTYPEAEKLGIKLDEKGRAVFGPGKVTVDRATADDLLRRQHAVIKSEAELIKGMDRTSGLIGNMG